jgi:pimeloyl-ACP methyl ester carboxylesterase
MTSPTTAEPLTLSFDRTGAGRPLLLIHGITENRHSLDPLAARLAEHFDVVAVDLRGHGASPIEPPYDLVTMAADVKHTVDAVWPDGPDPIVVGHSLGGAVATAFASAYPTRAVVNIDQPMDLAGFQAMVKSVEPMLRSDACDQVVVGMFEQMYGALPADEQDRLRAERTVRQEVVLGVWGLLFDLEPDELAATVDDIISNPDASPYLGIHGSDPGPDYPAWLTARVPGASLDIWPDLGHYPHLIRPDDVVDRVRTLAE